MAVLARGRSSKPQRRSCRAKKITVEPKVWVGAGVFAAPGVTIGHGAVMGARSGVLEGFFLRHDAATQVLAYRVTCGHAARHRRPAR